ASVAVPSHPGRTVRGPAGGAPALPRRRRVWPGARDLPDRARTRLAAERAGLAGGTAPGRGGRAGPAPRPGRGRPRALDPGLRRASRRDGPVGVAGSVDGAFRACLLRLRAGARLLAPPVRVPPGLVRRHLDPAVVVPRGRELRGRR